MVNTATGRAQRCRALGYVGSGGAGPGAGGVEGGGERTRRGPSCGVNGSAMSGGAAAGNARVCGCGAVLLRACGAVC